MKLPTIRLPYLFRIIQIGVVLIIIAEGIQYAMQIKVKPASATLPAKVIVSNNLNLAERWRWQGRVDNFYSSTKIVIQNEHLFLYSSNHKLYVFNLATGNIDWEKEIWNIRNVTANNDGVYVDKQGQILAFQSQTGEQLWGKTFYTGHGSLLDIYARNDILEVYFGSIYILASRTGEEQGKISYDGDLRFIFFRQGDILYLTTGNYLSAYDAKSDRDLWTHELDSNPFYWPIFVGDKIIVKTAQQIYAIKTDTGKVIWHTPKIEHQQGNDFKISQDAIISNIAVANDTIYAINFNNSLTGFDVETGEKAGTVDVDETNMTTMALKTLPKPSGYRLVAASDKYVAAYYGDSQELIVFERTEATP